MKIKVQEIPEDGLEISFTEKLVSFRSEDLVIEGPMTGKLSVTRQDAKDVHVRGRVETAVRLICGRCLSPFRHPIETDFYLDCTPTVDTPCEQEHRLVGEELYLHFYEGDLLEMDELIEGQLLLELPMAPLCRVDCAGLCPSCGEDQNAGPHLCLRGMTNGTSKA